MARHASGGGLPPSDGSIAHVWFDFGKFGVSTFEPDDPSVGLNDELRERLQSAAHWELEIIAHQLSQAETFVRAAAHEWASTTTPEAEQPFRERPLAGEHQLTAPPPNVDTALIGSDLGVQLLRAPIRWAVDLHDCATEYVETLLQQAVAAEGPLTKPKKRRRRRPWYSVRTIHYWRERAVYEERVTVWRAKSLGAAIALAEAEAAEYDAITEETEYLGLAQAFDIDRRAPLKPGVEVFSLARASELEPDQYLDHFFDTGQERQQHTNDSESDASS